MLPQTYVLSIPIDTERNKACLCLMARVKKFIYHYSFCNRFLSDFAWQLALFLPRFALRYEKDDDAEDHNPSEEQGE
jgi:hypothetical protein